MKNKISVILVFLFLLTLFPNNVYATQGENFIKGQILKEEVFYDEYGNKTVVEHYYIDSKSFYSEEFADTISILSVRAKATTTVGDTDLICEFPYFRQQIGVQTFTTVGTVNYYCERLPGAKEIVTEMWTENKVLGTAYYDDGSLGSFYRDYESRPHKSVTWVTSTKTQVEEDKTASNYPPINLDMAPGGQYTIMSRAKIYHPQLGWQTPKADVYL